MSQPDSEQGLGLWACQGRRACLASVNQANQPAGRRFLQPKQLGDRCGFVGRQNPSAVLPSTSLAGLSIEDVIDDLERQADAGGREPAKGIE